MVVTTQASGSIAFALVQPPGDATNYVYDLAVNDQCGNYSATGTAVVTVTDDDNNSTSANVNVLVQYQEGAGTP